MRRDPFTWGESDTFKYPRFSDDLMSEIVAWNLYQIILPMAKAFDKRNWEKLAEIGKEMAVLEGIVHDNFGYAYSRYISGEIMSTTGMRWMDIGLKSTTRKLAIKACSFIYELQQLILKMMNGEYCESVFELIACSENASIIYIPHLIYSTNYRGRPTDSLRIWDTFSRIKKTWSAMNEQ